MDVGGITIMLSPRKVVHDVSYYIHILKSLISQCFLNAGPNHRHFCIRRR